MAALAYNRLCSAPLPFKCLLDVAANLHMSVCFSAN